MNDILSQKERDELDRQISGMKTAYKNILGEYWCEECYNGMYGGGYSCDRHDWYSSKNNKHLKEIEIRCNQADTIAQRIYPDAIH